MGSIIIKNLTKTYDKQNVLKNISLDITDGSFTVILGPSGCGKSTLLRIMSGLEYADSGEIWISDKNSTNIEPKDRGIAMVFQNYALYPHMSVFKNIEYGLRIKKVPKEKRKKMVEKAIATVKLQGHEDKRPSQLSGGQRQRVALARAIVKNPSAFLMDEPLSNLDAKLRNEMRSTLMELHKELGTTFVYVTHDQTEAMTMADNIVLLNKGDIVQQGSPQEIYTNPIHTFAADFIGNPPTNLLKSDSGFIGFRPEDVLLKRQSRDDIEMFGKVLLSEPSGSEIIYNLQTNRGDIKVKSKNKWDLAPDNLTIFIPKDKLYYFNHEGERVSNIN